MRDERAYWIWLQQAFGAGSRMPWRLHSQYPGGVREFCEGGPKLWNSRRDLKDSEAAALRSFSAAQAEARLEYAEKIGWKVIVPGSRGYPRLLENIPDPPAVLYGKGEPTWINDMTPVAVVGSRKPLPVSEEAASRFGYQLAAGGCCVVSGGAAGVDAAALSGALRMPGARMVSVLPVSLDSAYLQENSRLRAMICEYGGALLSEYFSQQEPPYGAFQVRNRIVTGMCRGVVIVQAGKKGGGQIYVTRALEQDRDVFVFPGPRGAAEFAGSAEMLRDGAKPVFSGEEVLAEYGSAPVPAPRAKVKELFRAPALFEEDPAEPMLADPGPELSPRARQVWEALEPQPLSISQLEEKTGIAPAALLGVLTELELDGLAKSYPGKRYSRRR